MSRLKATCLCLIALALAGGAFASEVIPNWPAPATWTPTRSSGLHTLADATNPIPFIGLPPCRLVDTRGTVGVPINTGGKFAADETRTWVFTGICGIPASAAALSVSVTATDTEIIQFVGFVKIWPGGGVEPNVSTTDWQIPNTTVATAAIVPVGTSPAGSISLKTGNAGANILVDVNGYYPQTTAGNRLANGEFFAIYGTFITDAVIIGENDASSGTPRGVRGKVSGGVDNSAGVLGEATSGNGVTHGVHGRVNSNSDGASGILGSDSIGNGALNNLAGFTGSSGVRGTGFVGGIFTSPSKSGSGFGAGGALTDGNNGAVVSKGLLGTIVGTTGFGVFSSVGDIGCNACAKSFVDPHPTDPTKMIRYISLEGNEAGTYFRGTGETVDGNYVINVPEDFRMVTDSEGLTVQLTPVGAPATMYVVYEDLNQIIVHSSSDVRFHYLVQGIRPAYKNFQPIQDGNSYMPSSASSRMEASWPESVKARLVANGTYNPDGSVNVMTARRLGWDKVWEEAAKAGRQ